MRYLSLDEAGECVRRSPRALRALIHAGRLPAVKVGKSYVITEEDLHAVFRPVLRQPRTLGERLTPNQRVDRDLANGGFADFQTAVSREAQR
jgi:excisionase family DNA binding protein